MCCLLCILVCDAWLSIGVCWFGASSFVCVCVGLCVGGSCEVCCVVCCVCILCVVCV